MKRKTFTSEDDAVLIQYYRERIGKAVNLKHLVSVLGFTRTTICARAGVLKLTSGLRPKPATLFGVNHPQWKGVDASKSAKRLRAQKKFSVGLCERCGAKAVDRHHKDSDTGNNTAENIARLCRRCHMIVDGRLRTLGGIHRPKKPAGSCRNCSRIYKPLRNGKCAACAQYFRVHGFDRPPEGIRKPIVCEPCNAAKGDKMPNAKVELP